MRQDLIIHGVPDRIRLDGWWLDMTTEPTSPAQPRPAKRTSLMASLRMRHTVPLLAALVVLADWLFWNQPVGISFAVFALVLSVAILAAKPQKPTVKEWAVVTAFAVFSNLPAAIELQFLSVVFSLAGVIAVAAWAFAANTLNEALVLRMMLRLPTVGAMLLMRDAIHNMPATGYKTKVRHQAAALLLPLFMGAVFLSLLASANPVLEEFLAEIDLARLFEAQFWFRFLFWGVVASLLWPYLNLSERWMGTRARQFFVQKAGPTRIAFFINPVSVRNSLWLFNILFLIQTFLDVSILTGGVSLPEGMSYASYAHRGSYPLVATALLAGLFTLITRSMIGSDKTLRFLVYLWLGQNMFLVATAAIRLQHYVDAYALTYLRVAAFIWMALVLTGLLLTVWQVHRSLSTAWLLRRCFLALVAILYVCGLVNFAEIIAKYNLTHGSALAEPDSYYICSLGTGAYRAILKFEARTGQDLCNRMIELDLTRTEIRNWREWGYRKWQIQAYYRQQN